MMIKSSYCSNSYSYTQRSTDDFRMKQKNYPLHSGKVLPIIHVNFLFAQALEVQPIESLVVVSDGAGQFKVLIHALC
ncbi:hypothetical protein L2734_16335 [Parashewanella spongiae]|uniref:hypothetical protein n=1 Tax=Parashewanella spongiae TaxID=342950 RepID=UPI001A9CDC81|nr:hypothetical protein [Parashewanella spongiae]MCL1079711.1 hypothetical protein [Parashewanella spongiae]